MRTLAYELIKFPAGISIPRIMRILTNGKIKIETFETGIKLTGKVSEKSYK